MAKFCKNCGEALPEGAFVCVKCGVIVDDNVNFNNNNYNSNSKPGVKSKVAAGLLGIFLGSFGVHNFYLGYNGKRLLNY